MSFVFQARGHPAIRSTHPTTLELTKETHLTTSGDCVVAVDSSTGARDLPSELKEALSTTRAIVQLVLKTGPFKFVVEGRGDPRLTFTHPNDLVVRRSGFVSNRTLMTLADKSARDIPRRMVRHLQDPKNMVMIEISTLFAK